MCSSIDKNINIVDFCIMTVIHLQVKLWTIFQDQVMNLDILTIDDIDQVWSVILIVNILFLIEEQYHPPMVPSSIDFTTTVNLDISTVIDLNKVPMSFGSSLSRPELDVL